MSDDAPSAADLELLGLSEGASVEEIERAYRHQRALYGEDSLATYALLDGDARVRHLEALDEAYRKIKIAASLSPVPASAPTAAPPSHAPPPARKPAPNPGKAPEADVEAPGASLKRLREHRGLGLAELASRTRIRKTYLEALETEDYAALPALVYVRGFVQQVARELGEKRGDALAQAFAERCKASRGE